VRQLELIRRTDLRRPDQKPLPKLDEKTLRSLVALMAEMIMAVARSRKEARDDR
jgi:hypothetical protein